MEYAANQAMLELNKEKMRFIQLLAAVPDERLNCSPSDTSCTPLEIANHNASSAGGILEELQRNLIPGGGNPGRMDISYRRLRLSQHHRGTPSAAEILLLSGKIWKTAWRSGGWSMRTGSRLLSANIFSIEDFLSAAKVRKPGKTAMKAKFAAFGQACLKRGK